MFVLITATYNLPLCWVAASGKWEVPATCFHQRTWAAAPASFDLDIDFLPV